jgi:integrase
MKFLTKDELSAMLGQAMKSGPLDHLMILIAFNHGFRVSEVLSLTSKNFVDGHVIMQRLKGSCKTIQRLLPNEVAPIQALLAHRGVGERIFPFDRTTAWRHVKAIGIAAGIEAFKCFPHGLKHTSAVLGLKGGMTLPEIQTRLGHKSGASTMAYLRVDDETADKAFAAAIGGF